MQTEINKSCCFTGHRPNAFPWKENKQDPRCQNLFVEMEEAIDQVIADGVTHFICGNAMGVDTWAAEIVIEKKKTNPNLTLEIALPFEDHNKSIPEVLSVQKKAEMVHVVTETDYYKRAYHERNRYMVDHSKYLIAVYDERSGNTGGTQKTLEYARKKKKNVIQIKWMDC